MKYQKSMLKIYEALLYRLDRPLIIEELIEQTKVGRTSAYQALTFMEEQGFIIIKEVGKQKEVQLKKDRFTLQFKAYLDSFKFKQLPRDIKYTLYLFMENVKTVPGVKSILLFGSALEVKLPNDLDIVIVHADNLDRKRVEKVRNTVEFFSNFTINTHFDPWPSKERILYSVCLYGYDHIIDILLRKRKDIVELQDVIDWLDSAYLHLHDSDYFNECLQKSLINLGYVYCYHHQIHPATKEQARSLFLEHYPSLKKLKTVKGINKLNMLKKVVMQFGRELFN